LKSSLPLKEPKELEGGSQNHFKEQNVWEEEKIINDILKGFRTF